MGDNSEIQWTDATWNPVVGCSKVSPGCAHCYAESLTMRFASSWGVPGLPWTPANAAENVILKPERLDQPLHWKRPRMIFVNSMSDLFHEQVPDEYIARCFNVMAEAPQHVFQVLTKRPDRMRALLTEWDDFDSAESFPKMWPLPNVWVGTSIENRRYVGRADDLRATPAAVRFISAEPLLGPLVLDGVAPDPEGGVIRHWKDHKPQFYNPPLDLTDIDWLIVGGESGPKNRPAEKAWVRDLRDAALETRRDPGGPERYVGTSFFFKQWGGRTPKANGRLLDGQEWNEMPVGEPAKTEEAV
jgi:protein gp37